jgi:hypothetical protein
VGNLYGVFYLGESGSSAWAMTRNKRQALVIGRAKRGIVGCVHDVPEIRAYDAPTFRALMDVVYDYRPVDVWINRATGGQS